MWRAMVAVAGGVLLVALATYHGLLGPGGTAGDRVIIRFWNGFTGPDGRTMLELVQRFNEENPDVHVIMQRMGWGTYYNKLFVAGLGGRGPEVFIIHTDTMARFGWAGFLRPVDDLVGGEGQIDPADFDPNVWEAVFLNGRPYAVPLDIHPQGMYYNRSLFRQAGIVDDHGEPLPPSNREEFLDAADRIARLGDAMPEQVWGFVFTWLQNNALTLMFQHGGEIFTDDHRRTIVNSPENVAAVQFAVDLIHRHRVTPSPELLDSWIGFRQGRVGMAFEGIWMLPSLQRQAGLDYAAAPVPQLGPRQAVLTGSHNMCLRGDLEGRRLDAAVRFMQFLSDNSLDWAEGGQVPARRSLRETERFREMTVQWQFARQIPHIVYASSVPYVFEYMGELSLAFERALRGRVTPQQALDQAAENIQRIIDRYEAAGLLNGSRRE
jgi:multiple sugar transport system substrate-binding protein